MIMTVDTLRQYIDTDVTDQVLEGKLQALELLIRQYTNNNFQIRAFRTEAAICENLIICDSFTKIKVGDTVQISNSQFNDGLFTVETITGLLYTVNEDVYDENHVLLTKVYYPMDVQLGVVNMMKWELENREKVGIQSETISRHSVTYFNMDGDNSIMGFPKSLLGFLKPYMKARF